MARFNDQASSGLTIREWCSQNDISVHAYNYWKHIAKETYIDSVLPPIVPVNTAPTSISQTDSLSNNPVNSSELRDSRNLSVKLSANPVSIVIDDIRIEIGSAASDDMIISIIKAVRHA